MRRRNGRRRRRRADRVAGVRRPRPRQTGRADARRCGRRLPQLVRSCRSSVDRSVVRRRRARMTTGRHVLVAGGAGFLGSHLCDRLIERGDHVTCVDDLSTGRRFNLGHLVGHERFRLIEHDVVERTVIDATADATYHAVMHLASPASPPEYLRRPIDTLGRRQHGNPEPPRSRPSARRHLLPGVHERGLRRPARAPTGRDLLGQRQPDRGALGVRRGETIRRIAHHGVPPRVRPRHPDRAHLQHLRTAHAARRRPRDHELRQSGPRRRSDHDLRRRQPDAQLLLRRRRGRRLPRTARQPAHWARSTSATRTSSR